MKVCVSIVFAFVVSSSLSGCSAIKSFLYQGYSPPPLFSPETESKNYVELKRLSNFKKSLLSEGLITLNCSTTNDCESQRNAVAAGLIAASDNLCNEHLKTIFGNDAAYNLGFGTATNLFAGAATVAGSTGAKTLFSSLALFSNAERSLINETVYKTMLAPSITSKIREIRKTARSTLINNLDTKNVAQYPLDKSFQDVVDYHATCSFMLGLDLALKEGTQSNTSSKQASVRQSIRLTTLEYDTRINEVKVANSKSPPASIDDKLKSDPQLLGIINRLNALNETLKKLETGELN